MVEAGSAKGPESTGPESAGFSVGLYVFLIGGIIAVVA